MAEKRTLFRQESIDRMQSPEKIDEYIRVSTPKAWILVVALMLIIAGVIVWGFVGSIPKTATVNGVIYSGDFDGRQYDNAAVCLMPVSKAGQYLVGHEARVTFADGSGVSGKVVEVREDPLSYEEVQGMARSDWRLQTLWGETQENYQYALAIAPDFSAKDPGSSCA